MKDWKFIQVGNESIDKQEWSMFKGLTKKAESEVGNTWEWNVKDSDVIDYVTGVPSATTLQRLAQKHLGTYDTRSVQAFLVDRNSDKWAVVKAGVKPTVKSTNKVGNEDIPTEQDLKNWIRMSQQDMKDAQREMEKNKPLGHPDSYREEKYGRAKVKYDEAAKAIKKMEEELRQGKYKKVGNAEPKLTDMTGKNGSGVVERMSNLYFVSYNLNNGEKGIEKFPTESQAIAFLKKKIGNGKVYNARSKEQLLADVRELTKYIKDNPDRPCEKEKRLLGEAKEELDKRYGVIVGNFKTGKSKLSVGDKVSLYGVKGTVKSISGENGDNIYGEPVIEFESEDGKTKQVPEHYLVKVGNKQIAGDYYDVVMSGSHFYIYKNGGSQIIGPFNSEQEAQKKIDAIEKERNKIGNADTVSEYNAEIQRLTKKAEQLRRMGQGKSAMEIEKQIEKLGRELREIGNKKTGNAGQWNSTKTIYGKWDDKAGRPAEEYARITWLGQGKGGLVNIWRGNQMTSEKYGSNDLEDLRRWAEQRIGNSKYGSKEDIISHLDTDLYDIHKNMGGKDRPIFFYVSGLQKKGYDIGTISKFIKDIGKTVERLKTGNETLGQWAKEKPRIINGTWEEPRKMPFQEKSLRYAYEKAKSKGLSGKKLEDEMLRIVSTTPHESSANEQEKRNDVNKWILLNGESSDFVNNLHRARNAMVKNAMSVSDLERRIKENEKYIRSLQGKTVDGEGWPAKDAIQEAQDEIDMMKSRIAELTKQGNKKVCNLDTVEEGDYVTVRFQGELVDGVVRKVQGTQALVTIDNTDVWFPIRSLKEST